MASVVAAWPTVALGEVLQQVSRAEAVQPDKVYRLLGIRLEGKGPFLRETKLGSQTSATTLSQVRKGDFIYSRLFAWRGAFGTIDESLDGCYVSSEFPTFRPAPDQLDVEFLRYWFRLPTTLTVVEADCSGSTPLTRNRFKEQFFLALQIPLPPLDEQRRIVARIEALAARIAEARGLRQAAMAEAEALWETGACSLLDAYPKTTYVPLGEVVTVQGGGTPSKSNSLFWVGDIPWISPKDMKVRHISDSHDHISVDAVSQSTAKLVEPGAVLIVTRGMILAHTIPIAVLQKAATINQDMKALSPLSGLSPEYLCNVLWALNHDLLQLVERSSHDTRKLETAKLLGFEIPLPDLTTQESLIARFENMRAEVQAIQESQSETSIELNALLPSLLDKAFRGKL